jgi:hypothetical protein
MNMSTELMQADQHTGMAVMQETSSTVLAAQAKAVVEARFIMAMKRPRNEDEVRQRAIKECQRTSFASVAMYAKPMGGQKVTGLSIRAAEALLRIMGNIDIQSPTIYDDPKRRIIRVAVTDLESNICYTQDIIIEKTVERRSVKEGQQVLGSRTNSYGQVVHLVEATEDELLVKQAALRSKAIRTEGLRMVPGDLLDECKYVIKQTMEKQDYQDPDAAKRRLLDSFSEQGVTVKHLQEWLGHDGATFQPKELQELREIYAGLRDGETTWREVMEAKTGKAPESSKPAGDGKKPLKEQLRGRTPQPESDAPTHSHTQAPADPLQAAHDAMVAAENEEALNDAWKLVAEAKPTKAQEKEFSALYTTRLDELSSTG